MFLRTKQQGDRIRFQIVKSVRVGPTVRQRVLRHVGTATSEAQLEQLRILGRIMMEELSRSASSQLNLFTAREIGELYIQSRRAAQSPEPSGIDVAECRELGRVSVGVREAFGEMYSQLGWNRLAGARRPRANRILKELALARLQAPRSKRRTVEDLERRSEVSLNLDHVHDTMDLLDRAFAEDLCDRSWRLAETLLGQPVSVVFYDATTLHFESELEDGLRRKGFSKDGKPHRVQVVFAPLITADGIPCGYQVFPGDTWEGGTLVEALEDLSRRRPEARFTVVADAGMLNAATRKALADRDIPYILGARLRNESAARRARILDPDGFLPWGPQEDADAPAARYKEIPAGDARMVVTWSPKRARKDAHQRARALDRQRRHLERSSRLSAVGSRGNARFLAFPDGRVEIDPAKVAEAARWDGLGGIVARGLDDLDPRDLVIQYRRLSEIEACFRTNRHDLRIRPVFHWAERRVRAHIAICYMAFCCLQHLRWRLAAQGHPMSADAIRRELGQLEISVLQHKAGFGARYGMPARPTNAAKRIYRCLGLAWNRTPFRIAERKRKPRRARKRK